MSRPDGAGPLLVGGVAGLAWACGLRGWMQQFAGSTSHFTWWSFAMILAPATLAGALFAHCLAQSLAGRQPSRRYALTPLLMLTALVDPTIFRMLITNGEGGGSIWVTTTAITGGFGLSSRGRRWVRVTCRVVGGFLLLSIVAMGSSISSSDSPVGPTSGARDLWAGLLLGSLTAVFAVAASWPWRTPGPLRPRATVAFGALAGLAWAAALRAFMSDIAHQESAFTWAGTYLWILLPGATIGALLAYAALPTSRHRGWLVASPLLFASILVTAPFDTGGFLDGGVGAGTFALPLICIVGGLVFSGRGSVGVRVLAGLVLTSTIPVWALTASDVGGARFGLGTMHGAWAALFYWSLIATFSLASSLPQRVVQPHAVPHSGALSAEVTSR